MQNGRPRRRVVSSREAASDTHKTGLCTASSGLSYRLAHFRCGDQHTALAWLNGAHHASHAHVFCASHAVVSCYNR